MTKRLGILGCGWLGLPLARQLVEEGHLVSGTTTSSQKLEVLRSAGIDPYQIRLGEQRIEGDIRGFLNDIDLIIINVPPNLRRNTGGNFYQKMLLLYGEIEQSNIAHIVFVSSTSVYGDQEGEITEQTAPNPVTESGRQLLASESLFAQASSAKTTIVRFGGLIGPDRHPVHRLAGKKELQNGAELVNLIHLDDCINMITTIVAKGYWGELFNGVYPFHPTKKEYYTREALLRKLPPPNYIATERKKYQKIIISKNFLNKKKAFLTSISS